MNVAVGGTNGYFPDGQCAKTWSDTDPKAVNAFWNSRSDWYSTWDYPNTNQAAMKIDSVRVWDLSSESESAEEFTQ